MPTPGSSHARFGQLLLSWCAALLPGRRPGGQRGPQQPDSNRDNVPPSARPCGHGPHDRPYRLDRPGANQPIDASTSRSVPCLLATPTTPPESAPAQSSAPRRHDRDPSTGRVASLDASAASRSPDLRARAVRRNGGALPPLDRHQDLASASIRVAPSSKEAIRSASASQCPRGGGNGTGAGSGDQLGGRAPSPRPRCHGCQPLTPVSLRCGTFCIS